MEKEKKDRFQNAEDALSAIKSCIQNQKAPKYQRSKKILKEIYINMDIDKNADITKRESSLIDNDDGTVPIRDKIV
jgi:hypothetical protein